MITINSQLDMTPGAIPVVIHRSQYDSDFSIVFTLFARTGDFTIASGTTAKVRGTKKSGTGYSADAVLDISAKTVTVAGNQQMTVASGQNIFEIVLLSGTKELCSANFILNVEHAALDMDTITDDTVVRELDNLEQFVADAESARDAAAQSASEAAESARTLTIDATLTQSGQAADARATGDAITELKNDLEEVTDNYFYLKPQNKLGITITMPDPEVYNVNGSATGGMYINLGDGSSTGLPIPAGTYTFKVEYLDSSNVIPAASLGFYYNTSNNTSGATYITRGKAVTLTFSTTVYIFFRLANNGTTYSDMKFRAMVRRGTSAVYVPHRTAVDGIERSLTETTAFVITNNPDNFIEWNPTSKVLTVKRNGFVVGKNAMHSALSAQSVDFSSISTTNNAYRILVDINGTVHGKAWDDDAESNMFCIGLIYDSILYISGVNNFVHENIAMVARGMQKTAYIAWDGDIKTITVSTGTFIIGQNGVHYTLKAQTADFSAITTTYNAYRILVDSSGYIHGKAWTDDTDTGMLCIGMTYGNNVEIFGATDDTMSSKQKVYFFGDSIVAGVGSSYLFHMMLGLIENVICYNWGVGSTGYVATTSDSVRAGKGVIGRGGTSQESGGNTILDIMTGKEFTSCVIFGGTNDYGKNIPLATFRTAVQNTLDYALQKTNNILVITPLKRYYNNIPYTQVNSAGYTLSEYSAVIKEECEARAIGYVDGFNISLDPTNALNNSRLFADGLHPNEAGHERIAGAIRSAFEENCMVLL